MKQNVNGTLNRRLLAGLIVSLLVVMVLAVCGGVAFSGVLTFRDELAEQRQTVQDLQKQVDEAIAKQQEAEAAAAQAEGQNAALQKQLDELQSQLEAAKADLEAAQRQLSEMNSQLAAAGQPTASGTKAPVSYPADAKLVALTFDDGPGKNTTPRLLDELKKRNIPATFFVVGKNAERYPELLKRMVAEGHVIGNHSYSHKNLVKADAATLTEQITKCAQIIQKAVGFAPTLLRPPGGNYDARLLAYAKDTGLSLVNWSVDTRDWEHRDKDAILTAAFREGNYGIRDGAIVLMHDVYESTVEAAVAMMDRLTQEGYIMVTVPELLRARSGGAQPGVMYYSDKTSKASV